jgi:hypothetical protein
MVHTKHDYEKRGQLLPIMHATRTSLHLCIGSLCTTALVMQIAKKVGKPGNMIVPELDNCGD